MWEKIDANQCRVRGRDEQADVDTLFFAGGNHWVKPQWHGEAVVGAATSGGAAGVTLEEEEEKEGEKEGEGEAEGTWGYHVLEPNFSHNPIWSKIAPIMNNSTDLNVFHDFEGGLN